MRIDTEDLNAIFQWNLRVDYEAWILHIITSTIVILFIIAVSSVFEKKISPCIKYALWLIAVIKLLVPIPDFESEYHILNLIDNSIIWEKQEDIIKESNITQTDGRTELEKEQEYYEEKFTIEKDKEIKVTIKGFIDKIMTFEDNDNTYVIVVDYKTDSLKKGETEEALAQRLQEEYMKKQLHHPLSKTPHD